jgi:hypothetical protein
LLDGDATGTGNAGPGKVAPSASTIAVAIRVQFVDANIRNSSFWYKISSVRDGSREFPRRHN